MNDNTENKVEEQPPKRPRGRPRKVTEAPGSPKPKAKATALVEEEVVRVPGDRRPSRREKLLPHENKWKDDKRDCKDLLQDSKKLSQAKGKTKQRERPTRPSVQLMPVQCASCRRTCQVPVGFVHSESQYTCDRCIGTMVTRR